MIFLQIDSTSNVHRFFDTTPDSVYGLLVGGMAMVIVVLWGAYYFQTRAYMNKLVELNVSCVETLKDLSANLVALRDAGVNMTDDLKEKIDRTREHLATLISNFAENARHEKEK